ncbi:MAG: RNA-binding domain-containing protein [Methanomassiliicoccales archaeon]
MTLHYLSFRAFAHATEREERVREALFFASGAENIESIEAEGHHGNPITVLSTSLDRAREIREFFLRFEEEGRRAILDTLEDRIDDDCNIHLRLDKQKALLGELRVVGGDDVISVRGKVASYPKRRGRAIEGMKGFLEGL